jgi:hypothetical protein
MVLDPLQFMPLSFGIHFHRLSVMQLPLPSFFSRLKTHFITVAFKDEIDNRARREKRLLTCLWKRRYRNLIHYYYYYYYDSATFER